MQKFKSIGLWAVIILTAFAFAGAGTAKLMGVEMVHKSFAVLGFPVFFGYFIGACEIAGAVALFIRKLSSLAAAGLALIMVGAAYYHALYDMQGLPAAIILFVLAAIIVVARKDDSIFTKSKALAAA